METVEKSWYDLTRDEKRNVAENIYYYSYSIKMTIL